MYGTCVGNALKWFPDRRGLAAGATAAGFGAGAAITVVPIANMIAASGYQSAFLDFGIGQGLIVFMLAFFIRRADGGDAGQEEAAQSAANQDRLYAAAGAAQPDLLGHVRRVRDGRGRRI